MKATVCFEVIEEDHNVVRFCEKSAIFNRETKPKFSAQKAVTGRAMSYCLLGKRPYFSKIRG